MWHNNDPIQHNQYKYNHAAYNAMPVYGAISDIYLEVERLFHPGPWK